MGLEDLAGRALSGGAHLVGRGLDAVGLHDAAKGMELAGDAAGDRLGADVAEATLDEAMFAFELVHGDVGAIDQTTGHLRRFVDAFGETARGLAAIDTAHWQGEAADAFRAVYHQHPKQWADAESACQQAAEAWGSYAHAVRWAQGQAQQALQLYQQGKQASEQAQAAYQAEAEVYQAEAAAFDALATSGQPPRKPGPFVDPGAAQRRQAQEILDRARQQRDAEAARAEAAIRAATALAPAEPSFARRVLAEGADLVRGGWIEEEHFVGGVAKSLADTVRFARSLDPFDTANLTHPAAYLEGLTTTAAGLVHAATHPVELAKGLVGTGWRDDPFEALGKLAGNIALGAVTDGGGAAAKAAGSVAERAAAGAAERAATAGAERAATVGAEDAARTAATDAGKSAAEHAGTSAATDAGSAGLHEPPPHWGDFGPQPHHPDAPDLSAADQQAAHHLDQAGGGLGKVEADLHNIHVHDPGTTPSSAGTLDTGTAPSTNMPPTVGSADPAAAHKIADAGGGLSEIERKLAGLDNIGSEADGAIPHGFDTDPVSGEQPPHVDHLDYAGRLEYRATDDARATFRSAYQNYDQHLEAVRELIRTNTRYHDVAEEDLIGIRGYTTDDYYSDMNRGLRDGDPELIARYDAHARVATSGLNQLPRFEGTVGRGMNIPPESLDTVVSKYEVGKVVEENSFFSTDTSKAFPGNVQFELYSRTGRDIKELSVYAGTESEVLFTPGSKFLVQEKVFDPDTKTWYIKMYDVS
jgi:hypothetical protein